MNLKKNNNKVVTFGEIMLRLTPENYERILQADEFKAYYGGAEANVAVSLANFGIDSFFVTKLPDNLLGQAAINHVRRFGVNTDYILRGGTRLGKYFFEEGNDNRFPKLIYDRKQSSIAEIDSDKFNWEKVFSKADWFHYTGITPALGENVARATLKAVKEAQKQGLKVSCDMNYREQLWSENEARQTMTNLLEYTDILIANTGEIINVLGIECNDFSSEEKINTDNYKNIMKKLWKKFDLELAASHYRITYNASEYDWSILLYDGNKIFKSQNYKLNIIERVGGGDAFAGGLIYSLLENKNLSKVAEFCAAASSLKHSVPGDFNLVSVQEVEGLMEYKN